MDTRPAPPATAAPAVPLEPRRDVRLVARGDHLYVCTSTGTLRVPARLPAPRDADDGGTVPLDALPAPVLEGLRGRGLVHPEGRRPAHPLYGAAPTAPGGAVAVAAEGLGAEVAALLDRAGVRTVPAGHDAAGGRPDVDPDVDPDVTAAVLPLSLPEPALRRWTEASFAGGARLVVYLSTPTRLLRTVLDPPRTPCPVCLVRRIRANHTWQAVADLPLDALLGAARSAAWPTTAVAAGLLAHEVLTALTSGPGTGAAASPPALLTEFDHGSLEPVRHALYHLPGCPVCATRAAPPPARPECAAADRHGSWERMRGAVDPLTGLVPELRVDEGADRPDGTTYARTAGSTTTTWFSPVPAEARGGAVKSDPVTARVCAVGETLERYAAGVYDPARLLRAPYAALGDAAVDPRALPLGSAREYAEHTRYATFDPDTEIDWVPGRSLTTGGTRYVPACAVYLPYRFPRGHRAWFDPISTGLAAGATYHHAVHAGLMEVVERDATVLFWENRLVLPTLDLAPAGGRGPDCGGLPEGPAREIVRRVAAEGAAVSCKDLTTDLGIPAVAVRFASGSAARPVVIHAARADLDPHAALLGALEEACLGRAGARVWLEKLDAGARIPEPDDVLDTLRDFSLYYWAPDRLRHLAFWDEGPLRPVPPARAGGGYRADVEEAVRRLAARGYEAVAVDITPIDVAECGVSVVRTLVPGLCPITLRSDFHRRGGPRVFEAPVAMGARRTPLTEEELNPLPLPFL